MSPFSEVSQKWDTQIDRLRESTYQGGGEICRSFRPLHPRDFWRRAALMEAECEVDDASQPAGDAEIRPSVSPGSGVQPINPQGAEPFERAPVGPSPRKPADKRTTRSSPAKHGKQPSPKHLRQVSANPPFLPSLASARRSLGTGTSKEGQARNEVGAAKRLRRAGSDRT